MAVSLPSPAHLVVALVAALAVAGAARRVRALARSGAWAAALVGFLLFGLGGWPGAVSLLLFFATSTALSRWGRGRKATLGFEKGGERDAGQVLANGGVAAACAALLPLFPHCAPLIAALLGALAEANADTWATEVGALSPHPPRRITTGKIAPPGASGAISLPGTIAAVAGAAIIATVAPYWPNASRLLFPVLIAGFLGALFDSLLGATLQAQYQCPVCGKLTERRLHCEGAPAALAQGFAWMGNDLVNALATLFAALIAAQLACLMHLS